MPARRPAALALEDGTVFPGHGFGSHADAAGEAVFNTGMTGYQEIVTDPSYRGQIVALTVPHVGNYGVNDRDAEHKRPHAAALVVKELTEKPSNYRSTTTLDAYLAAHDVPGLCGIDTRALVRRLRTGGAQRAALGSLPHDELVDRARACPPMTGADFVRVVKPDGAGSWDETRGAWQSVPQQPHGPVVRGDGLHVVALDCGAKHNILRHLADRGVKVTLLPPDASPEEVRALRPDGLFVSNGPGDPAAVGYATDLLRALIRDGTPTFGICLGHQLLGRAIGADTFKLPFGHRGGNQPVKDLQTGRVEITSQNHGFSVDAQSLRAAGGEVTHINLNDGTVEGFRLRDLPVFGVQYHPESSPGPHDSAYLFDRFVSLMLASGRPAATPAMPA